MINTKNIFTRRFWGKETYFPTVRIVSLTIIIFRKLFGNNRIFIGLTTITIKTNCKDRRIWSINSTIARCYKKSVKGGRRRIARRTTSSAKRKDITFFFACSSSLLFILLLRSIFHLTRTTNITSIR
jgi:hypothetical protein